MSATPALSQHFLAAFRHGLREQGWVEGQNILLEPRWAEGRVERFSALTAELVQLKAAGDLGPRLEMAPVSEMHQALDPVCGMTVQVVNARYIATHEGQTYYFCSAGCQQTFETNPASFIGAA